MKTLRVVKDNVKIDFSEVPDHLVDSLAQATLRAVERYFEIPGVREDYEKWLVEYKKSKNCS